VVGAGPPSSLAASGPKSEAGDEVRASGNATPYGFVGHLIGAACPVEEEGVHDDEEGITTFGGNPVERPGKPVSRSGQFFGERKVSALLGLLRGEDFVSRGFRV
jgi:hypothetical protein